MKTMVRLSALVFAVLTAVICVPGTASASDKSDVTAVVNNAITYFNKSDGKAWEALCTSSAPVVDNIPPYEYSTCAAWWTSHAAFVKKLGISHEVVTLGTAWQLLVTGDRAYAAFPATYTYEQKGHANKTSGVLTIALQKNSSAWLMTGWSWSAH